MSRPPVSPLFTEEHIRQRVEELAAAIAPRLGPEPVLVALLTGAFVFTADLVRALSRQGVRPHVDFMVLSSYGKGTVSSGRVQVKLDCQESLAGRQVLLVDDILDSGNTLTFAIEHLRRKGATEVLTCLLLDKPERRQVPITADFLGFTVPNVFIVGYGIDYAEQYRELPFVAMVHEE